MNTPAPAYTDLEDMYEQKFQPVYARRSRFIFGRNGNWLKRVILFSLFLTAYFAVQRLASSLSDYHASLYDELHAFLANSTDLTRVHGRDVGYEDFGQHTLEVSKITMAYGNMSELYQRALARQMMHAEMHGYQTLILRSKIMGRLYTKPAYILSTILQELQKSEDERIKWLFWFDLDMVVMNPNIPLEVFLPPPELEDVDIIVTDDHNGLNTGAFFVRVNSWSAQVFADAVAMPSLHPEVPLKYSEQSALEILLNEKRNERHAVWVPQPWINGYRGKRDERGELTKVTPEATRKGDLQMHFAGKPSIKDLMLTYMDIAERRDPLWELPLEETGLEQETMSFWNNLAKARNTVSAGPETTAPGSALVDQQRGRHSND